MISNNENQITPHWLVGTLEITQIMDIVHENNFNLVLTIFDINFFTTIKSTDCRKFRIILNFLKRNCDLYL